MHTWEGRLQLDGRVQAEHGQWLGSICTLVSGVVGFAADSIKQLILKDVEQSVASTYGVLDKKLVYKLEMGAAAFSYF